MVGVWAGRKHAIGGLEEKGAYEVVWVATAGGSGAGGWMAVSAGGAFAVDLEYKFISLWGSSQQF